MDNNPLNTHVQAKRPKISPNTMCQRFWPVYGILVSPAGNRYRFEGEYIQTPTASPRMDISVAAPESQITTWVHTDELVRNQVKYSQCGIAPKYAPIRDARVVS